MLNSIGRSGCRNRAELTGLARSSRRDATATARWRSGLPRRERVPLTAGSAVTFFKPWVAMSSSLPVAMQLVPLRKRPISAEVKLIISWSSASPGWPPLKTREMVLVRT